MKVETLSDTRSSPGVLERHTQQQREPQGGAPDTTGTSPGVKGSPGVGEQQLASCDSPQKQPWRLDEQQHSHAGDADQVAGNQQHTSSCPPAEQYPVSTAEATDAVLDKLTCHLSGTKRFSAEADVQELPQAEPDVAPAGAAAAANAADASLVDGAPAALGGIISTAPEGAAAVKRQRLARPPVGWPVAAEQQRPIFSAHVQPASTGIPPGNLLMPGCFPMAPSTAAAHTGSTALGPLPPAPLNTSTAAVLPQHLPGIPVSWAAATGPMLGLSGSTIQAAAAAAAAAAATATRAAMGQDPSLGWTPAMAAAAMVAAAGAHEGAAVTAAAAAAALPRARHGHQTTRDRRHKLAAREEDISSRQGSLRVLGSASAGGAVQGMSAELSDAAQPAPPAATAPTQPEQQHQPALQQLIQFGAHPAGEAAAAADQQGLRVPASGMMGPTVGAAAVLQQRMAARTFAGISNGPAPAEVQGLADAVRLAALSGMLTNHTDGSQQRPAAAADAQVVGSLTQLAAAIPGTGAGVIASGYDQQQEPAAGIPEPMAAEQPSAEAAAVGSGDSGQATKDVLSQRFQEQQLRQQQLCMAALGSAGAAAAPTGSPAPAAATVGTVVTGGTTVQGPDSTHGAQQQGSGQHSDSAGQQQQQFGVAPSAPLLPAHWAPLTQFHQSVPVAANPGLGVASLPPIAVVATAAQRSGSDPLNSSPNQFQHGPHSGHHSAMLAAASAAGSVPGVTLPPPALAHLSAPQQPAMPHHMVGQHEHGWMPPGQAWRPPWTAAAAGNGHAASAAAHLPSLLPVAPVHHTVPPVGHTVGPGPLLPVAPVLGHTNGARAPEPVTPAEASMTSAAARLQQLQQHEAATLTPSGVTTTDVAPAAEAATADTEQTLREVSRQLQEHAKQQLQQAIAAAAAATNADGPQVEEGAAAEPAVAAAGKDAVAVCASERQLAAGMSVPMHVAAAWVAAEQQDFAAVMPAQQHRAVDAILAGAAQQHDKEPLHNDKLTDLVAGQQQQQRHSVDDLPGSVLAQQLGNSGRSTGTAEQSSGGANQATQQQQGSGSNGNGSNGNGSGSGQTAVAVPAALAQPAPKQPCGAGPMTGSAAPTTGSVAGQCSNPANQQTAAAAAAAITNANNAAVAIAAAAVAVAAQAVAATGGSGTAQSAGTHLMGCGGASGANGSGGTGGSGSNGLHGSNMVASNALQASNGNGSGAMGSGSGSGAMGSGTAGVGSGGAGSGQNNSQSEPVQLPASAAAIAAVAAQQQLLQAMFPAGLPASAAVTDVAVPTGDAAPAALIPPAAAGSHPAVAAPALQQQAAPAQHVPPAAAPAVRTHQEQQQMPSMAVFHSREQQHLPGVTAPAAAVQLAQQQQHQAAWWQQQQQLLAQQACQWQSGLSQQAALLQHLPAAVAVMGLQGLHHWPAAAGLLGSHCGQQQQQHQLHQQHQPFAATATGMTPQRLGQLPAQPVAMCAAAAAAAAENVALPGLAPHIPGLAPHDPAARTDAAGGAADASFGGATAGDGSGGTGGATDGTGNGSGGTGGGTGHGSGGTGTHGTGGTNGTSWGVKGSNTVGLTGLTSGGNAGAGSSLAAAAQYSGAIAGPAAAAAAAVFGHQHYAPFVLQQHQQQHGYSSHCAENTLGQAGLLASVSQQPQQHQHMHQEHHKPQSVAAQQQQQQFLQQCHSLMQQKLSQLQHLGANAAATAGLPPVSPLAESQQQLQQLQQQQEAVAAAAAAAAAMKPGGAANPALSGQALSLQNLLWLQQNAVSAVQHYHSLQHAQQVQQQQHLLQLPRTAAGPIENTAALNSWVPSTLPVQGVAAAAAGMQQAAALAAADNGSGGADGSGGGTGGGTGRGSNDPEGTAAAGNYATLVASSSYMPNLQQQQQHVHQARVVAPVSGVQLMPQQQQQQQPAVGFQHMHGQLQSQLLSQQLPFSQLAMPPVGTTPSPMPLLNSNAVQTQLPLAAGLSLPGLGAAAAAAGGGSSGGGSIMGLGGLLPPTSGGFAAPAPATLASLAPHSLVGSLLPPVSTSGSFWPSSLTNVALGLAPPHDLLPAAALLQQIAPNRGWADLGAQTAACFNAGLSPSLYWQYLTAAALLAQPPNSAAMVNAARAYHYFQQYLNPNAASDWLEDRTPSLASSAASEESAKESPNIERADRVSEAVDVDMEDGDLEPAAAAAAAGGAGDIAAVVDKAAAVAAVGAAGVRVGRKRAHAADTDSEQDEASSRRKYKQFS